MDQAALRKSIMPIRNLSLSNFPIYPNTAANKAINLSVLYVPLATFLQSIIPILLTVKGTLQTLAKSCPGPQLIFGGQT